MNRIYMRRDQLDVYSHDGSGASPSLNSRSTSKVVLLADLLPRGLWTTSTFCHGSGTRLVEEPTSSSRYRQFVSLLNMITRSFHDATIRQAKRLQVTGSYMLGASWSSQ